MEKSVEKTEVPAEEDVADGDTLEYAGCRARGMAFLVSVGLHVVLLFIAGMVVFNVYVRRQQQWLACRNEVSDDRFYDVPRHSFVRQPSADRSSMVDKPLIYTDEEFEISEDIPDGMSFDNLSNKNLEGNSCIDAYGIGGSPAGAYGTRWGDATLGEECDRSPG